MLESFGHMATHHNGVYNSDSIWEFRKAGEICDFSLGIV